MTVWIKNLSRAGILVCAGLLLISCQGVSSIAKHERPLDGQTKAKLQNMGLRQTDPILVRIFKEDSELEVWKRRKDSKQYVLFKSYDICKWSGALGPKIKEGDRQAPEGFYTVRPAQMNPWSSYHLSFNIGYPNAFDRSHGRTGSHLMVHGACSSRGCYSMTDEIIQEVYTLGRLAFMGGQRAFHLQAYPFRMTPENLARHRKSPHYEFWQNLKIGYDHFAVSKVPPKVDVCDRKYVFNGNSNSGKFVASQSCPDYAVSPGLQARVDKKHAADMVRFAALSSQYDSRDTKVAARAQKEAVDVARRKERAAERESRPPILFSRNSDSTDEKKPVLSGPQSKGTVPLIAFRPQRNPKSPSVEQNECSLFQRLRGKCDATN
jgi:murein L,D-transpeptidase YafK